MAFAQLTCVGPDGRADRRGGAGGVPARRARRPTTRPRLRRGARRAGRGLGGTAARPWPGCRSCGGSRTARRRSRTTAAAAQPAPAGGRRRPVDLAGRRELLGRAVLAAQRRHQARRRRAPRLPAARTRLRGRRRRPGADGVDHERERRLVARCPRSSSTGPGSPTRSTCSARCSSSRASACGRRLAGRTGYRPSLGLRDDQLSFLRYHADGDDEHFGLLPPRCAPGLFDDAAMARIVKTARVTARLYALQLEELDNV